MSAVEAPRREQLAVFYDAHHRRVTSAVRCRSTSTGTIVADACAYAWLALVRRPDITLDHHGLKWITVTATHQAWRLADQARREISIDALAASAHRIDVHDRSAARDEPLDRAIADELHHERARALSELKPRERRELLLHAAGYRYREIAARTGSTYTAVNRRMAEGHAALRASMTRSSIGV